MKRYGKLWDKLISWDNLVLAARKSQRHKRDRVSVQNFNFDQEHQLLQLQRELIDQSYQPGQFRTHWIAKPKQRMISVAPYRDRVMHHALMNLLEPILEKHFHPDSYACQRNKGTLAAANRLQKRMNQYKYALQCDIRKFFPSLDHIVMKTVFRRLIKDQKLLWLMDLIVDSSNEQPGEMNWFAGDDLFSPIEFKKGLPIGNLTSQWFANWYLNDLDHFITSESGIGAYVRYCDDFVVLGDSKADLKNVQLEIESFLDKYRLKLHKNKLFIRPVRCGLTFVGYRLWPTHRILKKKNVHNFRRRLKWMQKSYAQGHLDWPQIKQRLNSWLGYASHANTKTLIKTLSKQWKFKRGYTDHESCYPRRQLEQQCHQRCCDLSRQQQHANESQQQHRIPSRPALLEGNTNDNPFAQNHKVYGPCERGIESPGIVPELWFLISDSQIITVRTDGTGRLYRTSCLSFNKKCA
ncbi:MAG: RNA-dependent DNA polymerase [Phycisphaerae bacterium]|nr:RNA-dependent DNA polymerase [Phycisphaerae bacterium]